MDANDIRRRWMRLMGMSEREIDEQCGSVAVGTLDEELEQLEAAMRIRAGLQAIMPTTKDRR